MTPPMSPPDTLLLRAVQHLLTRYGVPRRLPVRDIGGYPVGMVPERLWQEWRACYDQYRCVVFAKVMHARGVLETRPRAEVRRLLLEKDAIAARLAEKAMRVGNDDTQSVGGA